MVPKFARGMIAIALVTAATACNLNERQRSDETSATAPLICDTQPTPSPFADPQAAFTHYAESINSANWCSAAKAFARPARVDLAVLSFRGFALLAGASNPKQAEYQAQFEQFCSVYKWDYASDAKLAALTASLMSSDDIDAQLSEVRSEAARAPESVYANIMKRLALVDPTSVGKLQLNLSEVIINKDGATGIATQLDGRRSPLSFVKVDDSGWAMVVK